VENVCSIPSNHRLPQLWLYLQLLSSLSMCVLQFSKIKESCKMYRKNMMNFRKLSLSRRHQYLPTRNKPTLLGDIWPVIRNSEHKLGSLDRSVCNILINLVTHKVQIMLHWGGCGKIRKLRKP